MSMKESIRKALQNRWVSEEEFFDARRYDKELVILDKRWFEGSMLVQYGYCTKEDWEKCFWLSAPSAMRCFDCKHSAICPKYVHSTHTQKEQEEAQAFFDKQRRNTK